MTNATRFGVGIVSLCMGGAMAEAVTAPPTPLGPNYNSSTYTGQLRVTTFASGLYYPTGMQQYGNGILVGTNGNSSSSAGFYSGGATMGHLLYMPDADHNGVADSQTDVTPAGGIPGSITAVQQAGSLLFVTSNVGGTTPIITVLQDGATPTTAFTKLGAINLGFSSSTWEHTSYALTARPTPNSPGNYDLLFNLGSRTNDTSDTGNFGTYYATAATTGTNVTGLSGSNHLDPESIYKTTVSFNSTTSVASFSTPTKVAGGLRNAAGMAFQPGTGDLYYEDNGIDGNNDLYGNAAFSLDTLHKIGAANIGVTVPTTRFDQDYYANGTSVTKVGNPDAIAHFVEFPPIDANNVSTKESEGPNQIAFAPSSFPTGLNNGVFIGFHGQFDATGAPNPSTGTGNEENPVVFNDLSANPANPYWHFIGTNEPNIGHLDSLLSTSDSLFMADITDGSLFSAPYNMGAIYEVTTLVPEPCTLVLLAAIPVLALRRHRGSR